MSGKRQATSELNHDNWDHDDPSEHEDMGSFKTASKDILEKRVIRTAKRRQGANEPTKSVFSGFGGFNKTQPPSFDFLAKLTNGNKATNDSSTEKSEAAAIKLPTTLFGNKTASSAIFNMPMSSASPTKPIFGITSSQTSLFGGTTNTTSGQSLFTASKSDSSGETPFKIKPASTDTGSTDTAAKTSMSGASTVTTPFKIQPMTNATKVESNFGVIPTPNNSRPDSKGDSKKDDKKLEYYAKLKGLNESVSDWIKKHVEETPLCILSPIFKDYEKYLKEIKAEYEDENEANNSSDKNSGAKQNPVDVTKTTSEMAKNSASSSITSSLFSSSPGSKTLQFSTQNSTATPAEKSTGFSFRITSSSNAPSTTPSGGFSFGINSSPKTTTANTSSPFFLATATTAETISNGTAFSSNAPSTTTPSGGFSFGINSSPKTTTANTLSPFSLATATTAETTGNGTAPFSFGIGKPFSFSPNVQNSNTKEEKQEDNEEDEQPKVEFTPVVEENSVFDKKCKIFVKKDGNYCDKGVGTLYIKKVEDSGKYQLLARANTNLGTVLLNLILSASIPTQRLGKNNVMMVCIPTPDAKPPPISILIRVKTSEEADELLETLNKYKV